MAVITEICLYRQERRALLRVCELLLVEYVPTSHAECEFHTRRGKHQKMKKKKKNKEAVATKREREREG